MLPYLNWENLNINLLLEKYELDQALIHTPILICQFSHLNLILLLGSIILVDQIFEMFNIWDDVIMVNCHGLGFGDSVKSVDSQVLWDTGIVHKTSKLGVDLIKILLTVLLLESGKGHFMWEP